MLALSHQVSQNRDLSCSNANDLLDSVSQLCELRASIKDCSLTDPPKIVTSLLSLDIAVVKWRAERSSRWDHKTVFGCTDSERIYDECYSVYRALWIAGSCNIQRATRIFIHEIILAQIDWMLSQPEFAADPTLASLSLQQAKSLAVILEMASEVCASVPYLLGHDKPYAEQVNNPSPAAGGYLLLVPLYLAGSTIGVPQEMRLYVLGRLRYIGHGLGIRLSLLFVEILQGKIAGGKLEEMEGFPRHLWEEVCCDKGGNESGQSSERLLRHSREEGDDGLGCELGGRLAGYLGDRVPEKSMRWK